MSDNKKAVIAAIIGNSIFGFSFLFSKIALGYVSPLVLLAVRFDIAFLSMCLLAGLKIIRLDYRGKDLKPLFLLGLLQPIFYFICENYGLNHASSSIAGVLIAVIPVVTFFTGSVFLKESFKVRQLMWAFVSLLGVCIISMVGQDAGNLELIGLILLLGAVLSGAVYNTVSRGISGQFSPSERTFMMFLMGAVFFTVMSVFMTEGSYISVLSEAFSHMDFIVTVIYLGAVSSIIAFYCLNYSVSYLPVRQAASFSSLTSIISVFAGLIFLHEKVSIIQTVAIFLILFGVYQVNFSEA